MIEDNVRCEPRTYMQSEAAGSSAAIRRLLASNGSLLPPLVDRLHALDPKLVLLLGRGSSDNAAVYAKYLIETRLNIITSHVAPSVSSLYHAEFDLPKTVCIAISQSGKSPDLVAAAENFRQSGAFIIAMVNCEKSPLADVADYVIPLCAGSEVSVAATKSFITSLACIADLIARWCNDQQLSDDLGKLADNLDRAWSLQWSSAAKRLTAANNLYVLGRGVGLGIAKEIALKLKETCAIHGEAYSSAEVLHGPAALIKNGFPILAISQNDATLPGLTQNLVRLAERGANIFATGVASPGIFNLPTVPTHPLLQPILSTIQSYRLIEAVSAARAMNPDAPPNLQKVTETL